MPNQTHFNIQRGAIVSDCMEETYEFINQNLEFFSHAIKPIKEALGAEGEVTFISHEDRWSFSCRVDKVELGRVALGQGIITEGAESPYDDLLAELTE